MHCATLGLNCFDLCAHERNNYRDPDFKKAAGGDAGDKPKDEAGAKDEAPKAEAPKA